MNIPGASWIQPDRTVAATRALHGLLSTSQSLLYREARECGKPALVHTDSTAGSGDVELHAWSTAFQPVFGCWRRDILDLGRQQRGTACCH